MLLSKTLAKIDRLKNYLAQISEREVEPHSSATPSSSWSLEIWGRGAAASVPTYGMISSRASTVDIPDPLSTSPESPILGFGATWSAGEVGAASWAKAVEAAEDGREGSRVATGGGGGRGWGSGAVGGASIRWGSGSGGTFGLGKGWGSGRTFNE